MKIIKQGDVSRLVHIRRFDCPLCGCVFEADNNEYGEVLSMMDIYWRITCPCCKKKTAWNKSECYEV